MMDEALNRKASMEQLEAALANLVCNSILMFISVNALDALQAARTAQDWAALMASNLKTAQENLNGCSEMRQVLS